MKGKTFSNGGFGTALPKEMLLCSNNHKGENLYLWVEEALFLHDSGLAEFYRNDKLLTTRDLFLLLEQVEIELPVYLVYAHLRSQTYRVLRYSQQKLKLQAEEVKTPDMRDQYRLLAAKAPSPTLWQDGLPLTLAWEVYQPNAQFVKTNPGPPDFLVAIVSYSQPSPTFHELLGILDQASTMIPTNTTNVGGSRLKIAAVSDAGTVVMFGLTQYGVPSIVDDQEDEEER
jgi:hypothetical protein